MPIPQAILDALGATQDAKDVADNAASEKAAAASAVVVAQAFSDARSADSSAANDTLDMTRERLDAIIDVYFRVGAPAPVPPAPPGPPS